MQRLIDQELIKWKTSLQRKALVLRGARQVGKTFSVRKLGQTYEDFYEINFEKRSDLHSLFEQNLDPQRLLRDLSVDRGSSIHPGKTLLFFDEIQACPQAILSLRYFYEEIPGLHIIGAGSLLEFAIEQIGLPVGRVQTLTVFPVSFAEFLIARGQKLLLQSICEQENLSELLHNKAIRLLSEYFVVGGLPEIVANWVANEQPLEIKDKLSLLINTYRQDFEKYAKKTQLKYLHLLLQHIPIQIGKKFKFQGIGEYRKRELAPCLELIEKAHLAHLVYHTSGQGIPLGAQTDLEKYKVILFDVAMTQQLLGLDLKGWFLKPEKEFINQGELVESFIGQEMMAYGDLTGRNNLYYWQREARGSEAEVDYLSTLQGEVIPIEVKAGKGSSLKSLHSFLTSHPKSPYGIKISLLKRSLFEKILSIPLFAGFELVEGGKERIHSLLLALLVLLCFGCHKKGDEWKHHEIVTGKIQYNSQRIYHPTEEIFCGLEYEIIRDHCTLRSYLNLFAGSVEGEPQNPQYVPVKLCIEEKPYTFLARRFCGGQRLLVPRPYTLLIISSLLCNKCCTLELEGGYFVMLTPSNFSHCWLSKPPLVPYPKFF